jgi:hypothetical protein
MLVLPSRMTGAAESRVGVQALACLARLGANPRPRPARCPLRRVRPFRSILLDKLHSRKSHIVYRKFTRPVSPSVGKCRRVSPSVGPSPPPGIFFPALTPLIKKVSFAKRTQFMPSDRRPGSVQPGQGQSSLIRPFCRKNDFSIRVHRCPSVVKKPLFAKRTQFSRLLDRYCTEMAR